MHKLLTDQIRYIYHLWTNTKRMTHKAYCLVWAPTRFRNDICIKLGRNNGAVLHYAWERAYRVDFYWNTFKDSITDFPRQDEYDLVTFFDCLHDMGDPSGAAARISRINFYHNGLIAQKCSKSKLSNS